MRRGRNDNNHDATTTTTTRRAWLSTAKAAVIDAKGLPLIANGGTAPQKPKIVRAQDATIRDEGGRKREEEEGRREERERQGRGMEETDI